MGSYFYLLLLTAVVPLMEVATMVFLGYLLATSYVNVLSEKPRILLSKLVFALFLPCLIFTELGDVLTLYDILQWWFIPVNVVLSSIVGCVLGYAVAILCGTPPNFHRLTIVMTGIGNVGNIPLAIITSMCLSDSNPFGDSDTCSSYGIAYVSFSQWISVLIIYTFVFHMLEPPDEDSNESLPASESFPTSESLPNHFLETEFPNLNDMKKEVSGLRTPWISKVFSKDNLDELDSLDHPQQPLLHHDDSDGEETQKEDVRDTIPCVAEPQQVRQIRIVAEHTPLKQFFQPAVWASILAIFIGSVPFLKNIFFGDSAPLEFLVDSLSIMANAMIPCIMLVLGGNLSQGPGRSQLGWKTTIASSVTKLVILPVVGMGIVYVVDKFGFLPPNDNMFKFVLLLQYTVPGSILAGGMANLRGYGDKEATGLLFWHHVSSFITMAVFLLVYINWLF